VSRTLASSTPAAEEPLAGEVAVDPATGRPAGRIQAFVLLLSSCLSVLGAVLLAPVLPRIQDAFAGTPGVEALTPVVLTAPALVIGLTAMIAGRIVDELGRKRLLVGALVVYAFVGTAPLWLPSLLTWALGPLTFEQRGRGTGVWTSAVFIGQFVCPLVVPGLTGALDGLGSALLVLGAVAVAAAVAVRLVRPTAAADPALAVH
jgi:MFS family permease